MGNIHRSFAIGSDGEKFIANIFANHGIECEKNEDSAKKYDYDLIAKIGRKKVTVEVKFDMLAQKTGNLAIEFYNSKLGKLSGIDITTADLWAHVILDSGNKTAWLTSVKKLIAFCKNVEPKRVITMGGDNNACLYLYSDEIILSEIFHRIDTVDKKEFDIIIKKLLI